MDWGSNRQSTKESQIAVPLETARKLGFN